MKFRHRALAMMLACVCLVSCLGILPSGAVTAAAASSSNQGTSTAQSGQDEEVRYTQKVVSVLYDNSGSMENTDAQKDHRASYAKYALQTLMSLLGENDILWITPMNQSGGAEITNTTQSIQVDLSATDRNAEIARVMKEAFFLKPNYLSLGGTPSKSISFALEKLTENGLMDATNLGKADENQEHWFVLMTDGGLDGKTSSTAVASAIKPKISTYPSLKTIYLAFGSSAIDLSGSSLQNEFLFTNYTASDASDVVFAMQQIAGQMSGRYNLSSVGSNVDYAVSGNTVTVDLSKSEMAFKSLSIVAQCGVSLKTATYDGASVPTSDACTISLDACVTPNNSLATLKLAGLKNGYSATLNGDPYFSGGTLTLTFSGNVDKDKISILAEPALSIQSYVEYYNKDTSKWEQTTAQYINANLSENDKIRFGYDVYEQATQTTVDITKLFGDVTSSVTYAGKTYAVKEEIPLVVGNNAATISVSVMNGAYTMYSSFLCIIERNPTNYRVEDDKKTEIPFLTRTTDVTYTVYIGGNAATKAELATYTWQATLTAPDGTRTTLPTTLVEEKVGNKTIARIKVTVNATDGMYGQYSVYFKVSSEFGISRDLSTVLAYNDDLYPTYYRIDAPLDGDIPYSDGKVEETYKIFFNNKQLTKAELDRYSWQITATAPDGSAAGVVTSVGNDGSIKAVISAKEKLFGDYNVYFRVTSPYGIVREHSHTLQYNIVENPLKIEQAHGNEIPYLKGSTELTFKILSDGQQIKKNEMDDYPWQIEATAPDGSAASVKTTVNANGDIVATLSAKTGVYGQYAVRFTVSTEPAFSREYTCELSYTEGSWQIVSTGPADAVKGETTADVSFMVSVNGVRLTKAELDKLRWTVEATAPDGTNALSGTATLANDGSIACRIGVQAHLYGTYGIRFTVTGADGKVYEQVHKIKNQPASMYVTGEHIEEMPTGQTKAEMKYTVFVDDLPLSKETLLKYGWTLTAISSDGTETPLVTEVTADGKVKAIFNTAVFAYGKYTMKFVFRLSDEVTSEYTHVFKYYPSAVSVGVQGSAELTLSEHQLTENETPFVFALLFDGTPFPFDSAEISYKLTVGGVDVTQYAVAEGNLLRYVPLAEHLGSTAAIGEKTVTLAIAYPEQPQLSTSATAILTVEKSVFVVEAVSLGNKSIRRFDLSEVDAALYFRVMRDGRSLSLSELEAAYDSGDLRVDDGGVFGWQFWLPVGKELSVREINGEAYLVVDITRDWIVPFDGYVAMLLFNGDKAVTVSYKEGSATDSVTVEASPVWSYIWRVLVILFCIHTILYVIGFFNGKCKSLPKGVFVTASLGTNGRVKEKFKVYSPTNMTWWEKYSWHIWRFFPHKKTLWYHQPPKMVRKVIFMIGEDGEPHFMFRKGGMYPASYTFPGNDAATIYEAFLEKARSPKEYRGGKPPRMKDPITVNDINDLFFVDPSVDPVEKDRYYPAINSYYISKHENKDMLENIIIFIPLR